MCESVFRPENAAVWLFICGKTEVSLIQEHSEDKK